MELNQHILKDMATKGAARTSGDTHGPEGLEGGANAEGRPIMQQSSSEGVVGATSQALQGIHVAARQVGGRGVELKDVLKYAEAHDLEGVHRHRQAEHQPLENVHPVQELREDLRPCYVSSMRPNPNTKVLGRMNNRNVSC